MEQKRRGEDVRTAGSQLEEGGGKEQRFIIALRGGYWNSVREFIDSEKFPKDFLESSEIQKAAEQGLEKLVRSFLEERSGLTGGAIAYMKNFIKDKNRVKEICVSAIVEDLGNGRVARINDLNRALGADIIEGNLPEIQDAGLKLLNAVLKKRDGFKVGRLIEEFGWSEDAVSGIQDEDSKKLFIASLDYERLNRGKEE